MIVGIGPGEDPAKTFDTVDRHQGNLFPAISPLGPNYEIGLMRVRLDQPIAPEERPNAGFPPRNTDKDVRRVHGVAPG